MKSINQPANIQFEHIATGQTVEFMAWITSFSDDYTSNWNSQELYGRMDPMMTFMNTARKITLEWDVVAESLEEAKLNMGKISSFIQMQYPTYAAGAGVKGTGGGASMIGSPPLLRAKFLNWVASPLNQRALVCALEGVSFKPDIEYGIFADKGDIYPQSFKLSVNMTILHEHFLGYSATDIGPRFGTKEQVITNFPYSIRPTGLAPPTQPPSTGNASDEEREAALAASVAEGGTPQAENADDG
jgi:hypothetical protein